MEVYKINGFKNFALLAFDYFPELKNIDAARKKMREQIDANLSLRSELAVADYTTHTTSLSPEMQRIIFQHWGPPQIFLPNNRLKTQI